MMMMKMMMCTIFRTTVQDTVIGPISFHLRDDKDDTTRDEKRDDVFLRAEGFWVDFLCLLLLLLPP